MHYYAGIGSRQTPDDILKLMNTFARNLYRAQYVLRSGSAPGADLAFEWGVWSAANDVKNANTYAEIYLPWKSFQDGTRTPIEPRLTEPQKEAYEIAEEFHPRWKYLKFGAKKLQARNVHQVMGPDVTNPTPVDFVLCWTPKASGSGGTGQAIRIAKSLNIPVFDLADPTSGIDLRNNLFGSVAY